jgi:hypothetical protein
VKSTILGWVEKLSIENFAGLAERVQISSNREKLHNVVCHQVGERCSVNTPSSGAAGCLMPYVSHPQLDNRKHIHHLDFMKSILLTPDNCVYQHLMPESRFN